MTRTALARLWIALACAALLLSGALAMVITSAKMPWIQQAIRDIELIRWCLVTHVNLATLVWFSALPAGLVQLQAARDPRVGDRVGAGGVWALALATLGILMMVLALPGPGIEPVMANYVPVVLHPQYLAGLALYAAAVGSNFVWPGLRLRQSSSSLRGALGLDECALGARIGAAYYVAGLVAFVVSLVSMQRLPQVQAMASKTYFEILMWGPGHLLQHFSVVFLVIVWVLVLSDRAGRPVLSRAQLLPVFAWLGLPLLAAPALVALFEPASHEYREGFTRLMRWGIFPPIVALAALLARRWPRKTGWWKDYALAATAWSMLLLAMGFVYGALIRGPDLRVPGHYHATIGAVTVAFMAMSYRLLAREGATRRISRAIWTYGIGQTLFASGMFVAGSFGLGRKTYGSEHVFTSAGQYVGMATMAVGGIVAFAGGFLFAIAILPQLKFRSLAGLSGRELLASASQRADRRLLMRPMYFVIGALMASMIGSMTLTVGMAADKKAAPSGKVGPSTPEKIAKGKASYQINCLSCHGANHDGKGPAGQYLKPAPRNLVSDPFKKGDKPEEIFATLTSGIPGTSMTAFGHLKDEDREALTHYVLSLRKK